MPHVLPALKKKKKGERVSRIRDDLLGADIISQGLLDSRQSPQQIRTVRQSQRAFQENAIYDGHARMACGVFRHAPGAVGGEGATAKLSVARGQS